MPTTLYFSYFHTNSIAMLYLVHKYEKKFESTNMDLTHSKIMIFLAFLISGYGCSTSHTIVPLTIGCKGHMTVLGIICPFFKRPEL